MARLLALACAHPPRTTDAGAGITIARGEGMMPSSTPEEEQRPTSKLARFQLERLIADDEIPYSWSTDDEPTLEAPAPSVPEDLPSPLGDEELPSAVPELTTVLVRTVPPFFPAIPSRPPASGPEAFAAARRAREEERRARRVREQTRLVVAGIWTTAVLLGVAFAWVAYA